MTSQQPIVAARMRVFEQLEYSAIAERLGVTVMAARRLVSQGMRELREEADKAKGQ